MLKLQEISCAYGKVQVLRKVSITVKQGSVVSIIGSNGAGKSTVLRTISGLLHPNQGSILYKNEDISQAKPEEIVRKGIIHIPEGRMVFPEFTVKENLMMGAYSRKDTKEIRIDAEKMFDSFPILRSREKQLAATLSGGEQQMLAIARGLMGRPGILMLDEPSLGLAPVIIDSVFSFLQELKKQGTTILLVEQNAMMALELADYAYVLETGTISIEGSGTELLHNDEVRNLYLGVKPKA
ncbi:MAG: ABC transporter ATP-binding protein [Sphaerochaetaceae bacterium]|jgi:branched-chain amino acid transport system ATP-binding protein|nr:ABC transporter ATP-binding protein [Sphaerochaetaceae bacterium]